MRGRGIGPSPSSVGRVRKGVVKVARRGDVGYEGGGGGAFSGRGGGPRLG